MRLIFVPIVLCLLLVPGESHEDKCTLDKDVGVACEDGTEPQVKWYFDSKLATCFAFKFNGCGGNVNRYDDNNSCRRSCLFTVEGWCSMNVEPAHTANGKPMICSQKPEHVQECPKDYICNPIVFVGACCPKESEDLYHHDTHPTCAEGSPVKMAFDFPLLGKSCDDQFCPEGSTCVKNTITAHCCQ